MADSLLYKVGTVIEPVTRVFGLGWRTFMGFITSAFAKEAVLGVLSTTYRESHSLKWTARIAAFYVCGALFLSCIVYHIAALFMQ